MDRRAADRRPLNFSLTCRTPACPRPAIVRDISYTGCKLEVPSAPLELGGTALLEVPGASQVSGHVVWAAGKMGGIHFDRPLGTPAAIAFGLEEEPEPIEEAPRHEEIHGQPQGMSLKSGAPLLSELSSIQKRGFFTAHREGQKNFPRLKKASRGLHTSSRVTSHFSA